MGAFVLAVVLAQQEGAVAAGEVHAVAAGELRAVVFLTTRSRWAVTEAGLAAAAFVVLCVVVLRASPYLPEPDDIAYRASIVAMTHGHFFTLSGAQAQALAQQVAPEPDLVEPGGGPIQWVQLAGGRWVSEKDPGYPYLAVAFQTLGVIRLAPLFFAALACLGLYFGARRWLGMFGGAAAVGLYCSSGAAIEFAWRDCDMERHTAREFQIAERLPDVGGVAMTVSSALRLVPARCGPLWPRARGTCTSRTPRATPVERSNGSVGRRAPATTPASSTTPSPRDVDGE